jgi:uncharacterized protein (TIGR03067 family)
LVLRPFEGQLGAADWLEISTAGTKLVSHPGQQDVTGTVVDHTGRPVPNASVVRSNGRIVKTDAEGKFLIPLLPRDQFLMNVAAPGFHVWTGWPASGDVVTVALEPKQSREEQRDHVGFGIDGEWELVELVVDGTRVEVAGRDMKVVVQSGHLTYFYGGKDQTKFAVFRIRSLGVADPPSIIDAEVINGLGRNQFQVLRGIYELKGDALRICLPDKADVARPAKFESPPGSALQLFRLRRVARNPIY